MAWYSPFLYTPFYIAAIYAFIFEKEWIRVPGKVVALNQISSQTELMSYQRRLAAHMLLVHGTLFAQVQRKMGSTQL